MKRKHFCFYRHHYVLTLLLHSAVIVEEREGIEKKERVQRFELFLKNVFFDIKNTSNPTHPINDYDHAHHDDDGDDAPLNACPLEE